MKSLHGNLIWHITWKRAIKDCISLAVQIVMNSFILLRFLVQMRCDYDQTETIKLPWSLWRLLRETYDVSPILNVKTFINIYLRLEKMHALIMIKYMINQSLNVYELNTCLHRFQYLDVFCSKIISIVKFYLNSFNKNSSQSWICFAPLLFKFKIKLHSN